LWDYYQQDKHQIAIRELQRLIHNFLASVKSLIDHTRNVVKDLYRNTKFYEEYALKVNSIFVDNRLAVFTQDLRNYFTHHSLPTVTPWVHLGTGSPAKPSYTLSRNELLNHYSGWTRKSKEFLQNSNDDLLLSSILDDYHALAEGFRVWFVERLKKIHALEFSHLESLQNRFHTLISKSFEESDKEIDKYGENVLGLVTPISAIRDSNK
jgi:hypothetical protein